MSSPRSTMLLRAAAACCLPKLRSGLHPPLLIRFQWEVVRRRVLHRRVEWLVAAASQFLMQLTPMEFSHGEEMLSSSFAGFHLFLWLAALVSDVLVRCSSYDPARAVRRLRVYNQHGQLQAVG